MKAEMVSSGGRSKAGFKVRDEIPSRTLKKKKKMSRDNQFGV